MIPILYEGTETLFTSNGLGKLVDAVKCTVTEERNGVFELSMEYPLNGQHYADIGLQKIILAQASDDAANRQAFEIYEIKEPINGIVTINARHISYRLNYIPVEPFSATGITATIAGLNAHAMITNPFTISSDLTNETSTYNQIEPKSFRSCLGGTQGSLLDVFAGAGSGEYLWNNFTVQFLQHRGSDLGATLRYSVNITDLTNTKNSANLYTGAIAWWHDEDYNLIYYSNPQYCSNHADYPYERVVMMDVSQDMDTAPSASQLDSMALAYAESGGTIDQNIELSFVDINRIEGIVGSRINLCDTITVIYKPFDIQVKKKVIKTVWDVLLNRYESIEIGTAKSSLASTVTGIITDVQHEIARQNSKMISIVQKVDEEIGSISVTIGEVQEDITGVSESFSTFQESFDGTVTTIVKRETDELGNRVEELETAVEVGIDGITITMSDSDIRAFFGAHSLVFLDGSDTKVAWIDATTSTFGAAELSVGDPSQISRRWRLFATEDGDHFRITRHS